MILRKTVGALVVVLVLSMSSPGLSRQDSYEDWVQRNDQLDRYLRALLEEVEKIQEPEQVKNIRNAIIELTKFSSTLKEYLRIAAEIRDIKHLPELLKQQEVILKARYEERRKDLKQRRRRKEISKEAYNTESFNLKFQYKERRAEIERNKKAHRADREARKRDSKRLKELRGELRRYRKQIINDKEWSRIRVILKECEAYVKHWKAEPCEAGALAEHVASVPHFRVKVLPPETPDDSPLRNGTWYLLSKDRSAAERLKVGDFDYCSVCESGVPSSSKCERELGKAHFNKGLGEPISIRLPEGEIDEGERRWWVHTWYEDMLGNRRSGSAKETDVLYHPAPPEARRITFDDAAKVKDGKFWRQRQIKVTWLDEEVGINKEYLVRLFEGTGRPSAAGELVVYDATREKHFLTDVNGNRFQELELVSKGWVEGTDTRFTHQHICDGRFYAIDVTPRSETGLMHLKQEGEGFDFKRYFEINPYYVEDRSAAQEANLVFSSAYLVMVDTTAPEGPFEKGLSDRESDENILGKWTRQKDLLLTFQIPEDYSGIKRFYMSGFRPTAPKQSRNQRKEATDEEKSGEIQQIQLSREARGVIRLCIGPEAETWDGYTYQLPLGEGETSKRFKVYLWFEDAAGNEGFESAGEVEVLYDEKAPVGPKRTFAF